MCIRLSIRSRPSRVQRQPGLASISRQNQTETAVEEKPIRFVRLEATRMVQVHVRISMVSRSVFRAFVPASAPAVLALLALALPPSTGSAQTTSGSTLPATAPTTLGNGTGTGIAPLAGIATRADQPGSRRHKPQVSCDGGQLTVHADNSSLNGILRAIAACTGMRITGGVIDQRVYGNYGPAAPATILATLLDGTGSNMLLQETASAAPAELILTMRTGGPTPPGPRDVPEDDFSDGGAAPAPTANSQPQPPAASQNRNAGSPPPGYSNQTPVPQPLAGSVVTSPPSIPQPTNNVNGSPNNTSYTAGSYPTTDSVPLDSVATPSTTPSTSGIVDAPNPPAAGSDTANLLNGTSNGAPGTTNIVPGPTSDTTTPGATNTTTPVSNGAPQPGADTTTPAALTPQQVYQQLQQLRQAQQSPQQPAQQPAQQPQ